MNILFIIILIVLIIQIFFLISYLIKAIKNKDNENWLIYFSLSISSLISLLAFIICTFSTLYVKFFLLFFSNSITGENFLTSYFSSYLSLFLLFIYFIFFIIGLIIKCIQVKNNKKNNICIPKLDRKTKLKYMIMPSIVIIILTIIVCIITLIWYNFS